MTAVRRYMSKAWRAEYGQTLTGDEIRLVQAQRGLPAERQEHLRRYAAALVVDEASAGRVNVEATMLAQHPSPDELDVRRWAKDMGRVARRLRP